MNMNDTTTSRPTPRRKRQRTDSPSPSFIDMDPSSCSSALHSLRAHLRHQPHGHSHHHRSTTTMNYDLCLFDTNDTPHQNNVRRRRSSRMGRGHRASFLLASLLATISSLSLPTQVSSHKNFCGIDWGDASSGCANRQPCPSGINEECTFGGICWGDTSCDTANGDGILYDLEHPTHSRFCGSSWNDADTNCKLSRHCPSGDSDECPKGQNCYSFLSGCNYVDMIGGPAAGATIGGGDDGDGGGVNKIPSNDPSRSNFCGSDWNDALANCDEHDHWCQTGSDAECPPGKLCYAGTDCKYVADLFPTLTPTNKPSYEPTPSPIKYNTAENTRFCGTGWEDVHNTCRIGSHCPSGSNSDCPGSQTCYGWITGCNIIDFEQYLEDNGNEIFGIEHWLMPEEGLGIEDVGEPGAKKTPQLPPAEMFKPTPAKNGSPPAQNDSPPTPPTRPPTTHAPIAGLWVPPPTPPGPPTRTPISSPPTKYNRNQYIAENHVFCGKSWNDATERCSPETFCSGGASHRCENDGDFCWVGVSACSATDWVPTGVPTEQPITRVTARPTTRMPTKRPTRLPTKWPTRQPTKPTHQPTEQPISVLSAAKPSPSSPQATETTTTQIIRQSYCAIDYASVMADCATLSTCNRYKPCPDGYMCFSNVRCTVTVTNSADSPVSNAPISISPISNAPISNAPMSNAPISNAPITRPPTAQPTVLTLSEYQVAQRFTSTNNYCASSMSQILSSCSYSLYTCNASDKRMCPAGTFCFENIVCPDPEAVTKAPVTPAPTSQPTVLKLSEYEVAQRFSNTNNYCASSMSQILSSCSYSLYTCNASDNRMCPAGTSCFENIVCPDPEAVTKTPVTSAPTSQPTVLKLSEYDVAQRFSNTNNYCASSMSQILSSCSDSLYTCNASDKRMCPAGTFCFENIVCPDPEAVTKAPVTSEPTPRPTNMPTTQRPIHTNDSINNLNSGNDSNEVGAMAQNYCAKNENEVERTCATALTCNSDDEPCPSGMFCFGNHVCDTSLGVETIPPRVTPIPTFVPTRPPSPRPTLTSTSALSNSSDGNNGNNINNDVANPQNYCSTSEDILKETCATAQTCNDGDGPCTSGTFCFGNFVCSNGSSSVMNASESIPDGTSSFTISDTKPTPKPALTSISAALSKPNTGTSDKNNMDVNTKQNYCAQSLEQLTVSCARAPTCNSEDGPCPTGTYCFPNVVCESSIQAADILQHDGSGKAQPPTAMPTTLAHYTSIAHDTYSASNDPACSYLCLQPVDPLDCDHVLDKIIYFSNTADDHLLPCTGFPSQVDVGDFCTATGRCGTDLELNNCSPNPDNNEQGDDIYVRVESSRCVEFGFLSGDGVIPSSRTHDGGDGGNTNTGDVLGGGTNAQPDHKMQPSSSGGFGENTETAREASNNGANNGEDNETWELLAPENDNSAGGDSDNPDHLTGWWREGPTSAGISVRRKKKNLITLALFVGFSRLW